METLLAEVPLMRLTVGFEGKGFSSALYSLSFKCLLNIK